MDTFVFAGIYCALSLTWLIGTTTCALLQPLKRRSVIPTSFPGVTIVVPTSANDTPRTSSERAAAVSSLLCIEHSDVEILICIDRAEPDDRIARDLEARFASRGIRTVSASDGNSPNAKIDAMDVGLRHASNDLILFSDDDILVDPHHLSHLVANFDKDVGLVSSAAIGTDARNFAGHLECSFMNGQFARLHLAGDCVGFSGALGKTILMRRSDVGAIGGLLPANQDCCEDAALTRMVRRSRRRVVLSDLPVRQPIGEQNFRDVLRRHRRWLGCRRKYIPAVFIAEALFSTIPTAFVAAVTADGLFGSPLIGAVSVILLWGILDTAFSMALRYTGRYTIPAWIVRELVFLPLWGVALFARTVVWYGRSVPVSGIETRQVTGQSARF